ncbi:uncharacterized protein LOC125498548 [Beta vulgaris subsp. vulgaris]|uniref:uncharacterized protein LOC125498548 n=1 Tax=Beta vulgaris subsp. vulgaris TaxID=3555 RepID=UPI0025476CC9|nr:uncharacterized protein LOC125498548 [Beta vulgaris subsp. vulgaris]
MGSAEEGGDFGLQELLEIEGMEDELLMHEMWTHYNSEDDTEDDDDGGTAAADGSESEQPNHQGNPEQQNTEIDHNSKRFKIKAMFMCATSRPIKDSEGRMIHDGKFGIYPFVEYARAKYSTKNRRAGTMLTKAIESVTLPVMRDMIVNTIIPAIMRNWPEDPQFIAAATQNGFNIQLINQPAQSPDLNVLDLGFFRAIQALQYQSFPKNLDELILRVQDCYDFFDPEVLKYTWLQLQYVMVEILKCKGGNNFKNPHHAKRKLERLGLLPENVTVDQAVIDEAVTYLNERFVNVGEAFDYLDAHQE